MAQLHTARDLALTHHGAPHHWFLIITYCYLLEEEKVSALNQSFESIVIHWPFMGLPALLQVGLLVLHYTRP